MDLTPKQETFCQEYLKCNNASEAYRQVYNCERMKPATINRKAKELLDHGKITARLDILRLEVQKTAVIDAAFVLEQHKTIHEMGLSDIMNDDWTLKPLSQWPAVWNQMITAIDVKEIFAGQSDAGAAIGLLQKLKWPDKLKNLELLGKHVSIQAYKEKIAVENDGPPVIEVTFMLPDGTTVVEGA